MPFRLQETAAALEQKIRARRLMDIPGAWSGELIFPSYDGLSLRNVPHSAAALLNAPLKNSVPLDNAVWGGEFPSKPVNRVVIFLMDGMGYRHLNMLVEQDEEVRQAVSDLTDGRGALPLTSVLPSTTAVALTTLWTGAAPGATGITGTFTYLREYSMIGDMLSFRPVPGRSAADTLINWGLVTDTFVPMPGMAEQFAAQGIETHLLLANTLMGSGLSRILHRGITQRHTHMSYTDFLPRLHGILRDTAGKRGYIGIYHPGLDTLAHAYGAHNVFTATEIKTYLMRLRDMLSDPAVCDGQTMVMILSDHGHYDAPQTIDLKEDAAAAPIRDAMLISLTGDERLSNIYLRHGTLDSVKATIERHYADRLTYMETEKALNAGVYGSDLMPGIRSRLGDLVLLPRLGWKMRDSVIPPLSLVSVHAGMDAWEMLIPLLWKVI